MKTNSLFGFSAKMVALIALVYLSSCKKEVSQTGVDNGGTIAKVNTWLQSQKQQANFVSGSSVDKLVANLDFSNLHFETLNATEKLILVPLKSGFVSDVNKGKNPLNLLLLVQNKEGNIRKGNIVQFTKKDGSKTESLPENTFYNFYNKDWLVCDGKFSFLNLNDKILYEMGYDNGRLSTYGEKSSQPSDKANTFTSGPSAAAMDYTGCTDWYLVTTEYFADGTSTQSEVFLYQTCDGLEQTMEGGGGGGGELEEVMTPTQIQWVVAANALGYWYVTSTEQLSGTKKASEPGGGHFTGIVHLGDDVVNNGMQYIWIKQGVTVSYGAASAHSTISGILKCPNFPDVSIPPKTRDFIFSQVFP